MISFRKSNIKKPILLLFRKTNIKKTILMILVLEKLISKKMILMISFRKKEYQKK